MGTRHNAAIMRLLIGVMLLLAGLMSAEAQQYTGMSGLIHVPSAEMDSAGVARIGAHFLNRHFTPGHRYWHYEGKKYDTGDFYLSLTPFSWMELGFTITLLKHKAADEGWAGSAANGPDKSGYNRKDRYFSIKFRPLKEGRWYPAIALGANDFLSSSPFSSNSSDNNGFWRNYYIAATKHLDINRHRLGATIAYRYFTGYYNHRWQGVTGGVTYRPSFAENFRAIVEWTGCDLNIGIDCLLWKHLLLQASLQRGRWPSAGAAYVIDLF